MRDIKESSQTHPFPQSATPLLGRHLTVRFTCDVQSVDVAVKVTQSVDVAVKVTQSVDVTVKVTQLVDVAVKVTHMDK